METIKDFGQTTPQLVFSYDHQDRVTWITYLNNGEVCYEYDPDGRITRVGRVLPGNNASVCSSANEKTDYVYDGKGRLKTITYPNGVQSFTEYDGNTGLIKVAGNRSATGALLYSDTFAYYPNSHLYQSITRKTPTGSETTQYTYDAYERLLTVTEADGRKTAYEYDAFGNRTKETVTNINDAGATGGSPKAYGIYVYEYPAGSNRLSRILFNGQPQETFTYDNAGRITQRVHSTAGTTTYGYDDRGLLATVTKSGTTISYTYDALGVRKSKTVNGTRTNYLTAPLFGMSRVLAELNTNQTVKATYVYGGSQQIKEEPAIADRGKDLYLVHDGIIGNITHAIDMTGSLRNQFEYDAFGIRTQVSAAATGSYKHYGYTGEEYDEETGLVYLRARYYDPTLGRFISADPFWGRLEEPASQNRYIYVQNNPILYTDPQGLAVGDWWDLPANFSKTQEIAVEELEKRPMSHNDMGDAMRHAEWMQRTTQETNVFTAWVAGTGHEIEGALNGQPMDEMIMDLHNNAVGRSAGSNEMQVNSSQLWTLPLEDSQYNPYQNVCR